MSIAVDAMGGDRAPGEIVRGVLQAADEVKSHIYLVGEPTHLRPHFSGNLPRNVEIRPATQWVDMEEKPSVAFRTKKDSSLMVCARLVKEGAAQALVSAGNTGAASAISLLTWRQIPGIHRPAIVSRMPSLHGGFAMLDSGASPDVDPENLVEFAIMGRAYCDRVMGRPDPKVHLLNIGEEPGKGNAFSQQAFKVLSQYSWFAGNIEPKEAFHGKCDVAVCEGFVGNMVLKASEGIAELISKLIKQEVPDNPMMRAMYWPVQKATRPLRKELDYAEFGGAPLLGLNGLTFICHGRSDARAIKNAVKAADVAVQNGLLEAIRSSVSKELSATA